MNYTEHKIGATSAKVRRFESGAEVLISYSTPVAAYIPGEGYYRTSVRYSVTTSKQINKWLQGVKAQERDPEFFMKLAEV